MDLDEIYERYQEALAAFARGDPAPVKALYSRNDDVMLANPFGPAVTGWSAVSEALDYASSRFSRGEVTAVERKTQYVSSDLACLHELERWRTHVGDRGEASEFALRVTTTFRREAGGWHLVHRHADPIDRANPDGPLGTRGT